MVTSRRVSGGVLGIAVAVGALAGSAADCMAQTPCGVRSSFRIAGSVSGATVSGERQINTTWLTAAPAVGTASVSTSNATGQFSMMSVEASASYGECLLTAGGSAQSGSGNGVFFWLDEYFGGAPKAEFSDRLTVSSATLPLNTPVQLRFTLSLEGAATLIDINPQLTYSASLQVENSGGQNLTQVATGIGSQSVVFPTFVGRTVSVYSGLFLTSRAYGVQGGGFNTASLTCNLRSRVTMEVLTAGVTISSCSGATYAPPPTCGTSDFDGDGDIGTDADIEAFFACLAGNCCPTCWSGGADFNGDGDLGTDADIESFFRVLAGGAC